MEGVPGTSSVFQNYKKRALSPCVDNQMSKKALSPSSVMKILDDLSGEEELFLSDNESASSGCFDSRSSGDDADIADSQQNTDEGNIFEWDDVESFFSQVYYYTEFIKHARIF